MLIQTLNYNTKKFAYIWTTSVVKAEQLPLDLTRARTARGSCCFGADLLFWCMESLFPGEEAAGRGLRPRRTRRQYYFYHYY